MLSRPNGFEDSLLGGQAAERVISLRGETNSSGKSESDGFSSVTTLSVDFTNV